MKRSPTVLQPQPSADFVETAYVRQTTERALGYLRCGFPVHFTGQAGTGKTTLALHLASQLGRPVVMLFGDDQMGSNDMVGGMNGYHHRRVVDRFIHTVLKTEDELTHRWVDNRLTVACQYGLTMIYDEFTRSRPETNNVLLSVLEERLLPLPAARHGQGFMEVHPEFRAIFTSNPSDYVGVHKTQDALLDRMITMKLEGYDRDSEVAITVAKAGVNQATAEQIVELVQRSRAAGGTARGSSIRSSMAIARALKHWNLKPSSKSTQFRQLCADILGAEAAAAAFRNGSERRLTVTLASAVTSLPAFGGEVNGG